MVGHDGRVYNVTMEPGDMVLYESHTVLHGRPFEMRGRYYANVFVHFAPLDDGMDEREPDVGGSFPNFVANGSREAEKYWRDQLGYGRRKSAAAGGRGRNESSSGGGGPSAGTAAALGRLEEIRRWGKTDPEELTAMDENGWQPIHEASRSGSLDVIQYLVFSGADPTATTYQGLTPLSLVLEYYGEDHPAVKFLRSRLHGKKDEL